MPVNEPQPSGREPLFRTVREALRGSRRDLTEVPLGRAILLLAVPMVSEMIMESIFAVVDIFWVSKLGPDAVAAVGLTESLMTNGAGDTRTPTLINLFCFWLWEIPLAYVLARPLGFGPPGVFFAITVGFSTFAVVAVLLFRRGRWKAVVV
jgi:Na+-driven multidrug efflux pump